MTDSYADIIQAWAKHRHDAAPMALHEMLDCHADNPERVRHARWLAAIENCVRTFMQLGPDEADTLH